MSADDGMSESVSVGVRWLSCSMDQSVNYLTVLSQETVPKTFAYTHVLNQVLDHLLLALAHLQLALMIVYGTSSLCSTHARVLHPYRHPLAGVHGPLHTLLLPQV
jgi:hypothetical protein